MLNPTPSPAPDDGVTVAFETDLDPAVWSDLADRVPAHLRFLAHGWWRAWGDAMLPHGNWRGPLRLAVARDRDGVVQAVLPLAEQTMAGLAVLSLAGNYKPFRCWLLADGAPPATAACVVGFLRKSGARALRMGPVVSDEPSIRTLKQALDEAGWRYLPYHRGVNYLIDMPADVDAYQAMLAPRKFKRIRANLNRLAKQGEVRIERRSGLDAVGWRAAIDDAAAVERASWLSRAEDADYNFAEPAMAAFWRGWLARPEGSRSTHLWLVYVDDRPVSFTLTFDSGDHRYNLCGLYDQDFAKGSPGAVIDKEAIVDSFDHGIRVYDLGQGDSGYKANWGATVEQPIEDGIAFPPSAAGRILALAARAKFRNAGS